MRNLRKSIRAVSELTQRIQELQASIPPYPVHSLTPKARACLDEWRNRQSPEQLYAALISDESPFPVTPGSVIEIKPSDDNETILSAYLDAYRTEIETGARLLEMRWVFERLQGAIK